MTWIDLFRNFTERMNLLSSPDESFVRVKNFRISFNLPCHMYSVIFKTAVAKSQTLKNYMQGINVNRCLYMYLEISNVFFGDKSSWHENILHWWSVRKIHILTRLKTYHDYKGGCNVSLRAAENVTNSITWNFGYILDVFALCFIKINAWKYKRKQTKGKREK